MDGVDPDTLLEWLQTGTGDERDLQLMALEQLCMLLLMSDNIDRCFEHCPPRTFIPALCKIFLDETAPENCLEVTARAITYYLDVSNECTRRITQVEGAVKAICNRLAVAEMTDRTSKDLAEQCVKLLEHVCQRETTAVYEAGGLQCMLHLIRQQGQYVHKDTMHSAMNVVTRLCSKMEPQDASLPQCSADLGALLGHDDPKVSECALRCFAALTDRFVRKSLDPMDLAKPSNLVEHLLSSLVPAADSSATEAYADANAVPRTRPSSFTSIVLSLLSNLCRGSSKVTDQVIRSPKLVPALKAVLSSKDERCVMDSLRLADLLIVLLCEGRAALPRSSATFSGSEPAAPTGIERAHRYLIDAIRQRDTDALIDAVENGTVEANFTDDVGQTLLNWCSAFGTADMVIYLCDKGADVNKGQRSSSLHYAACFGRPDIVKILLRNGANPDLRDEEGRTALDKARERNDEGHQQVVQILESPTSYMMERCSQPQSGTHDSKNKPETAGPPEEPVDSAIVKSILQQLIPVFCNIFKNTLVAGVRRSTLTLIRKCILSISNEALHEILSTSPSPEDDQADLVESLMEVLITVFDHEEDADGQEQVLLVLKSLLTKDSDFWLEQIVRLGVFDKVEALAVNASSHRGVSGVTLSKAIAEIPVIADSTSAAADSSSTSSSSTHDATKKKSPSPSAAQPPLLNIPVQTEEEAAASDAPVQPAATSKPQGSSRSSGHHGFAAGVVEAANAVAEALGIQIEDEVTQRISSSSGQEDTWTITQGVSYKWKDWRLIRSADSLFLWCDAVAIEFSDGSNGWLRFLMDGKLYTMYSSGSPEAGADNAETRAEFVGKLQKAKAAVPSGSQTRTIFTNPSTGRAIESGNWMITSSVANELVFKNQEGSQQRLLIKEDLPGFIFESNKHSRQSFTAESTLGLDFVTGWAARGGGRRLQFRAEAQRQKIHDLAKDVWENYLKEARTKPRDALVELQRAAAHIEQFVAKSKSDTVSAESLKKLRETLQVIRSSVINDRLLSTFELSVSGVVPAILALVPAALASKNSPIAKCFREVFADPRDFTSLVRKMVLVLESVEKFPQCLYDAPGGSAFGLQLLTRRLRFRLEQADPTSEHQKQLLDRSNRAMKSEPLTTVGSLKNFLHRMVAKRWYDHPREDYDFVKKLKEIKESKDRMTLTYESDFDDKGLIWWLGTNGKTSTEWTNPASVGVVNVVCSDGSKQPYGQPEDVLSRDVSPLNCHSTDSQDASFTIDLGVLIYPTAYTLRHARGYGRSALRNWLLQASRDNHVWDFLVAHSDDQSLNEPGSTATWPIACETGQGPYRYIRIAQNGKNSSGVTYYLSLSGFEIYGNVVDVVDKLQPMDIPQSGSSFVTPKDKSSQPQPPWAVTKKQTRRYPTSTTSSTLSKTLGGVHAARPPTAAVGLRTARKGQQQPSSLEKPPKPGTLNNGPFGADAADPLYSQLPGGAANHKLAAGYSLASLLGQSSSRSKSQRYRRPNRHAGGLGAPPPLPDAPTVDPVPQLSVGTRVIPGLHWRWGSTSSRQGTVIAVGNPDGWVDVEWDDGSSNSYRYGDSGKREVDMLPGASATSATGLQLFTPRGQRDSFFRSKNQFGSHFRPAVVVKHASSAPKPPSQVKEQDVQESPNFLSSKAANNPATASATGSNSGTTTSMSQKSMSTTNLFDGKKEVPRSVASTNQAASAESLQHQTPSLENLLARSRIYGEGIPEAVGDEHSPSDGPLDITTSAESIDSSAHAISVAASSFAGGSQPALSPKTSSARPQESLSAASSANALTDELARANRDVVSSPREHLNSERTLEEPMDDGAKNLSVSAPNLAIGRQRQRVSAGSCGATGPVENNLLFLEEEESFDTDDTHESLADIKEEGFEPAGRRNETQSVSEVAEEDGIVDIEQDDDNDGLLDEEFLNKLIHSRDFFGLVDAYTEELALAENDLNEESNTTGQPSSDGIRGAAATEGSSANASSSRRPLSSLLSGSGIRSKLGNYAEVIRNMMQQMMDSGSISAFDSDEIDIRLTDDVYDDDDITDEGNDNDDCDDFGTHPSSNNSGSASATSTLHSQVESLASAAAALRRQFSSNSTASSSQNAAGNPQSTGLASEKLNWRQLVMSEAGRFLYDVAGSGSSSNAADSSFVSALGGDAANTGGRNSKRVLNRTWDDDFVLRRQFSALIPAFDPRPGRTNINQTQDVELPENDAELPPLNHHRNALMYSSSNNSISSSQPPKIKLYLKGPNLADVPNAVVELEEDDATIFAYVQKLLSITEWGQKLDKCRRVWEPTYTLIYENPLPEGENSTVDISKQPNKDVVPESRSLVRQTLDLLTHLNNFVDVHNLDVPKDVFLSTKLTQKLTQELTDCLVVSARALPEWCNVLVYEYPCLFTTDTRSMQLRSSAFGTSRAIVWLQNRRDQILEQTRSSGAGAGSNLAGSRREDHYPEYRIGRIRHERIKVHRNDELLLENAVKVMKFHATRKSVLEIEYVGEEGTGLGPTLEFYALVAAEFQRKSLAHGSSSVAMWLCDDADEQQAKLESSELDLGEGRKPPGYYVRRAGGLFPAPLPPDSEESLKVSELFRILGIFLAKVLQDGRLVDFPLSTLFLKLLIHPQVAEGTEPSLDRLLTLDDFERIHPHKANFLRELNNLVERKRRINCDEQLPSNAKRQRLEELRLKLGDTECAVEDLALTFALNPPSSVFAYRDHELIPNGAEIDVTVENVELYLEKCLDFYLNTGIRQQVSAFRQGFDMVFPLRSLISFSPEEVQTLLSGEQCPEWSREDILKFTEPKLGYTRDSPGFLRFVDVLVSMSASERKAFLQFTTGCSSLPPGGLANLHPRLTVVRKVDSGDGSYPSVNTCVHYLKLPEYSSAEILRERLLAATNEKGFHLN